MDYLAKYAYWQENLKDPVLREELEKMNDQEKRESFTLDLEFGTGGLRGILGVGTSRMNVHTVRQATQGLASLICGLGKKEMERGVAIAYDCRNFSDVFAREAAKVLAGKNIIVDTKDIPDKVSDVSIFNITNKYKSVSDYATVLHENAKAEGLDYFNPDSTVVNDGVLTYKGKAAPLKNVRKGLKKIGALNSYNYKCTQTDNTILYNVLYDGLCVNDTYLSATVDDDTLTITLSNWLADSYKNTGFSSVRTAPEALISFSNSVSFEQPFKITSVTQGYLAGSRNGEIQTSTAAPVWKISGENGINYYVDMRNGDFLKND